SGMTCGSPQELLLFVPYSIPHTLRSYSIFRIFVTNKRGPFDPNIILYVLIFELILYLYTDNIKFFGIITVLYMGINFIICIKQGKEISVFPYWVGELKKWRDISLKRKIIITTKSLVVLWIMFWLLGGEIRLNYSISAPLAFMINDKTILVECRNHEGTETGYHSLIITRSGSVYLSTEKNGTLLQRSPRRVAQNRDDKLSLIGKISFIDLLKIKRDIQGISEGDIKHYGMYWGEIVHQPAEGGNNVYEDHREINGLLQKDMVEPVSYQMYQYNSQKWKYDGQIIEFDNKLSFAVYDEKALLVWKAVRGSWFFDRFIACVNN
ncbi:MAG: hypothetical protein IJ600_09930, partial [Lachnospiraceae bacterium]|nr:hypothetical protein [Lachnospiraceae bacterium]